MNDSIELLLKSVSEGRIVTAFADGKAIVKGKVNMSNNRLMFLDDTKIHMSSITSVTVWRSGSVSFTLDRRWKVAAFQNRELG